MAKSEMNNSCDLDFFREKVYRKSVFKNPEVLDFTYIPDVIDCRNDTITSLIFHYRRILVEKSLSINCLLLGPCGSGKTTIAKFFIRNFRQIALEQMPEFIAEYFNCIETRSNGAIVSKLLKKYCYYSGKGIANEEAWICLLTHLKSHKIYLFIVLDEVHNLSQQSLLELLCLSETFGHQNSNLSFLLISREEDWLLIENERILSRINRKIRIYPYDKESANLILSRRSWIAFQEDILSNEIIEEVSRLVVSTKNMRHGIEVLRKCGLYADERNIKKITLNMVKEASKDTYSEYRKIIDFLKEHELLILYSFLLELKDNESTSNNNAYRRYKSICREFNVKSHTIMDFRKKERSLEQNKLLNSKLVHLVKGKRGVRKKITLPHSTNRIIKELENHFKKRYSKEINFLENQGGKIIE